MCLCSDYGADDEKMMAQLINRMRPHANGDASGVCCSRHGAGSILIGDDGDDDARQVLSSQRLLPRRPPLSLRWTTHRCRKCCEPLAHGAPCRVPHCCNHKRLLRRPGAGSRPPWRPLSWPPERPSSIAGELSSRPKDGGASVHDESWNDDEMSCNCVTTG